MKDSTLESEPAWVLDSWVSMSISLSSLAASSWLGPSRREDVVEKKAEVARGACETILDLIGDVNAGRVEVVARRAKLLGALRKKVRSIVAV